jgi:hypothetical protein
VNEQVLDFRPAPGEQVIQTTDVVAVSEKPLAEVRGYEAGAAGDENIYFKTRL